MAKKFGKWRGSITALAGLGAFLIGKAVNEISTVVHAMVPNMDESVESYPLILATLTFYLLGIVIALWGL